MNHRLNIIRSDSYLHGFFSASSLFKLTANKRISELENGWIICSIGIHHQRHLVLMCRKDIQLFSSASSISVGIT